jgi:hypothetical protein
MHDQYFFIVVGFPFRRFGFKARLDDGYDSFVAVTLLLVPVPPTYFCWIVDGFMPPGLLMMLAHFGICLYATSGAYFLPQY